MTVGHQPGIGDCGKIARDIVELSRKKNVDPFLVASIIATESRFHVEAKSSVGAVGLMQVLPSTGKEIFGAITGKKSYPTLTDTRTNISLGIEYLKQLENELKIVRHKIFSLKSKERKIAWREKDTINSDSFWLR